MFEGAMNQANAPQGQEDEAGNEDKVVYNDPKDRRRGIVKRGGADKELTTLTIGAAR